MNSLDGKVALVTGGSRGIGAAVVQSLAKVGARVAALSRTGADPGVPGVLCVACDLRDRDAVGAAVDDVARQLGGLDIVVPNAGVGSYGPFVSLRPEDLEIALRPMKEASWG